MLIGCPDPELLSRLLDRELGAEEEATLRRHVENCAVCGAHFRQLGKVKDTVQAELRHARSRSSLSTLSSTCLSPERIAAYVHRLLPADEYAVAERHVSACPACLGEVMEALRVNKTLKRTRQASVPAALKARVASHWEQLSAPAVTEEAKLSRFVLQLAQKGVQLVDQYLVTPLLDVHTLLAPQPAYRVDEVWAPLQLTLHADQATIAITAVPEGTGLSLRLTMMGPDAAVLTGQRVFLRQNGKSIFSARTNHEGLIQIPHIEPGMYELSCAGIQTSFQLELRAPA
jgi:hypothetical protein